MMTSLIAAAAAVAALASAPVAFAQDTGKEGLYGSLGYSTFDGEGAVQGRIGTRLNSWFGVEGEGALGFDDGVDNELGIYATGFVPVSENVDLIGRVGYARIEGDVRETDGVAYGVGAQWFPNGGLNGVRGDYTRHESDDADTDVFALSYVRKF